MNYYDKNHGFLIARGSNIRQTGAPIPPSNPLDLSEKVLGRMPGERQRCNSWLTSSVQRLSGHQKTLYSNSQNVLTPSLSHSSRDRPTVYPHLFARILGYETSSSHRTKLLHTASGQQFQHRNNDTQMLLPPIPDLNGHQWVYTSIRRRKREIDGFVALHQEVGDAIPQLFGDYPRWGFLI